MNHKQSDNKAQGDAMKIRYAVLLVMAIFVGLSLSAKVFAGNGGSSSNGNQVWQGGIPYPSGQFSSTVQGSFALCLNPTTFASESCGSTGVLVFPLTVLGYGALTEDSSGNSCGPFTEVDSAQPLTASPPTITTNEHVVGKLLNYDSTTGTGDGSFTVYSGGSCSGVTFDGSGATELSSGTDHLVVTKDGNRVDFVFTTLTDSAGAIGGFSISGVDLRQTRPEF